MREGIRYASVQIEFHPKELDIDFRTITCTLNFLLLRIFLLNVANLLEKYNDLEELFENGPLNEKRFIKWKTAM